MTPSPVNKKTTLVLSASFQPMGFFSAKLAIHNLVSGGVRAVSNDGGIYHFDEWIKLDFGEDHPCLRSSNKEFPIPTIVTVPGFFGNHKKGKNKGKCSPLRQIFNLYGGVCQYCLKEIKYSVATKDHVLPKSKGGENFDNNIVLACKKCNNKKAAKFPFLNALGSEVKIKKMSHIQYAISVSNIKVRPEWAPFLNK